MSKEKSPIDNFFFNLYGVYPEKAGQAYELLVAAALKILNENSDVKYNQFEAGIYSQQKYQLDGIIDEKTVEAKDYTIRGNAVGRPDVQKQEGGLIDLPYEKGIFASATGYTRNAIKYAEGTYKNPIGKEIDLYEIRPSTEEDEEGRIKTIIVNIISYYPVFDKGKYTPVFTEESENRLSQKYKEGFLSIRLDNIYNEDKSILISIPDWVNGLNNQLKFNKENDTLKGETDFPNKLIFFNDEYYEIEKLTYDIPINHYDTELKVEQDGNACLFVKNANGTVDKLLTDVQMKSIIFDDGIVK